MLRRVGVQHWRHRARYFVTVCVTLFAQLFDNSSEVLLPRFLGILLDWRWPDSVQECTPLAIRTIVSRAVELLTQLRLVVLWNCKLFHNFVLTVGKSALSSMISLNER